MRKAFLSLIAALLTLALPVMAIAETTAQIVSRLQEKYDSITTVEASFTQDVFSKAMKSTQKSEGRVWFKKPGKMRWEYKGSKDLIVSDGKNIWVYQPDLNQAIEKTVESTASGMATDFLSGVGNLEKEFTITAEESAGKPVKLVLLPKKEQPGMKKLVLEVDRDTYLIEGTTVTDHYGNETRVRFKDMKTNSPLKDSMFKFSAPKGAKIVRP